MASLLTDAEKTAINSALSDVHDTFSRTIYVYVEEASTVPAELNYNPLYGRTKNAAKISSETTLTRHSFSARIYYKNEQNEDIIDGNGQMSLLASEGQVRIKVKSDAYEKIKICSISYPYLINFFCTMADHQLYCNSLNNFFVKSESSL